MTSLSVLSVLGTQVSYRKTGQGPLLLLLHGSGGDGQSTFGHLIDQFTDAFTVVVPDYAGCGNSTIPEGELLPDLLVSQVAAVLSDLGNQPASVVGLSMGAQVAAALAAKHPALIYRLVLVGGRAGSEDARHQMVFDLWSRLEALDPRLADHFMLSLAVGPQFLHAQGSERLNQFLHRPLPLAIKQRIDLGRRTNNRSDLSKITAPTLVIGMKQDYLVPVYHAKELHTLIRGSQYAELDCGHAVFREAADQVVSVLRDFLM